MQTATVFGGEYLPHDLVEGRGFIVVGPGPGIGTLSAASIRSTEALFRLAATAAAKPPLPAVITLISQDLVCMGY